MVIYWFINIYINKNIIKTKKIKNIAYILIIVLIKVLEWIRYMIIIYLIIVIIYNRKYIILIFLGYFLFRYTKTIRSIIIYIKNIRF